MRKRNDREVIDRILRDCHHLDIKVSLMSIIGFPTETEQEAWNTIKYYLDHSEQISFVTLHRFSVSAGSPIMHNPLLCNIELERIPGLLQPRYRYSNKNPGGISPDEVEALVPELEKVIRHKYPQHAEIHTVGIGGWLTFLACCRHSSSFFKRPTEIKMLNQTPSGKAVVQELEGTDVIFGFDVPAVEKLARGGSVLSRISEEPHCVILSSDGRRLVVVPAIPKDRRI
jgi:hypothetical protein